MPKTVKSLQQKFYKRKRDTLEQWGQCNYTATESHHWPCPHLAAGGDNKASTANKEEMLA